VVAAPRRGHNLLVASNGGWAQEVRELTARLKNVPAVQTRRPASEGEHPAATLAHALVDIEEECRAYVQHHLPRLRAASTQDEIETALIEIREAVRHIAYHIKDAAYLSDVLE
jgi:hypothetical protein